ncbi:uncharacterized protein LOC106872928 isoform X2 [Octopus bimaculoides]|nr:uncharacterized protein LOC106872928 isoform X2 [Octopus bimaculoides]XP_052821760.1 uncharacterized protein LOC106872928 isoform X2 [Octopus bimaculoides]XP_052821761.1 uncharacterized protein LOC106872928 isoform X2 [Octopus bimaculoides]
MSADLEIADYEKDEGKGILFIGFTALIVIGLLLLIILLPLSFSYLDYYQMGVVKNKVTGSVSLDRVYSNGRYLIGPSHEFKVFKADAHVEYINNIRVFTSDKLEVGLSGAFQYFLRLHQLSYLHKKYDVYYKDKVVKKANEAVKNVVTGFTTRSVFKERKRLESALLLGLKNTLGGVCCSRGCTPDENVNNSTDITMPLGENVCLEGCKPRINCTEEDYGMFVDVRYFQLGPVDIPDDLDQSFLNTLILKAGAERQKHFQAAKLVRKETEQKVKNFENHAAEILESAKSDSKLITETMDANASFIVESARIIGLKNLYSTLNLTDMRQRNKFDYLRSLQKVNDLRLTIGYNQKISGSFPKV